MSVSAGKGDTPRPVDRKKWDATWDRIKKERDNEREKDENSTRSFKPAQANRSY